MIIRLAKSIGTGPTKLSAFDNALYNAGIANYNLLRLSSVIPPSTDLQVQERAANLPGDWGDRLYVVMAEQRVAEPGREAWAGIGWVQDAETGKGLFVEHEGDSEDMVRYDIQQSLTALMRTRGVDFGPLHMEITGGICKDQPLCAMVVAAYQSSDWHNQATLLAKKD